MYANKVFSTGTPEDIYKMISDRLPPIEGYYTWHGKGIRLLFTVIEILVYLRETKFAVIDYGKVIRLIKLRNLEALINSDIPEHCRDVLKEYVSGLLPVGNEYPVHEFITFRFLKIDTSDFL
ncbi:MULTISPECIES: hypothetical protein [Pectobacterium]|uniref:Uncharacterized protein n=1 Tax=Pectobacterium carotovorum TaxID=554 RepID=A0A419AS21_PECCA|nr:MULTISPECIES: hypothetical protein [Pectobacterium]RJL48216.1 hypothetical protein D5071_18620 [Pectobacterium carotovorum]